MKPTVAIIQPMYNPIRNWEHATVDYMEQILSLLPNYDVSLIIVNDGSTQGVAKATINFIAKQITNFTYINNTDNHGKGYAIRCGVAHCTTDYVIYTDIDFPFEIENIPQVLQTLVNGADIAVGVRSQNYYNSLNWQRKLSSKASRLLNTTFLKIPFNDTQSGLKGFRNKARQVFLDTRINRYLFDTEFLAMAATSTNLVIHTTPIVLRDGIVFTHMSTRTMLHELYNFAYVVAKAIMNRFKTKNKL
jgi:glycosyltransferase involved in cell wall biosynthesis